MKKLAAQQVQRETEEGQKRLEEALVKAREEYMIEKANAVQKAREEEKVIATEEAKRVAQVEEDKRKQLILASEKEKQVNIHGSCSYLFSLMSCRLAIVQQSTNYII